MLLNNLFLLHESHPVHIAVFGEKIRSIGRTQLKEDPDPFQIYFSEALAVPGLINSHDHLDFNCFPVLGQIKYNNYTEWGKHIHENYQEQIQAVMEIPLKWRVAWGIYKNLLAGVTTVVHHGSFLKIENPLINIYQNAQNLHSVRFEKQWKWKLNSPFYKKKDCVIHTGEGSDESAREEIDELIKFNLFGRRLIGVHGVAMRPGQASNFKGLVWCPESNRVLLNAHAPIEQLKQHTQLVFGTDSTLTGSWNIWRHLRLARSLDLVDDNELFDMINRAPAKLWNMQNGELTAKKDADLVIVRKRDLPSAWDAFFLTNPADILLVMHKGKIRLFDKSLLPQLTRLPINLNKFSQFRMQGAVKFVEGDLPALIESIKTYNPSVKFPVDLFENLFHSSHD